jgi:hypothetical protein
VGFFHSKRPGATHAAETPEGQAFLSESGAAKDHALRLIEIWTETSLEPLFTRLNFLGEKVRL